MDLRKSTILASMYLGYVLIFTLHPFEFSRTGPQSFSVLGLEPRDFVLNTLLFIPLGVFVYCRLVTDEKKLSTILVVAIVGVVISVLIELFQIFLARYPSAVDVVANTLGTVVGAVLAALWPCRLADLGGHAWQRVERSRMVLYMAVLYGALPLFSPSRSLLGHSATGVHFSVCKLATKQHSTGHGWGRYTLLLYTTGHCPRTR
jgi:VanZ family protein